MRLGNTFIFVLLTLILGGLITSGVGSAEERNPPFPSYGSGPVEVRLYTDYFCPPCRAMEPAVEPILKELLKKNAIRLTLVDVPYNQLTPLFARNFFMPSRRTMIWIMPFGSGTSFLRPPPTRRLRRRNGSERCSR